MLIGAATVIFVMLLFLGHDLYVRRRELVRTLLQASNALSTAVVYADEGHRELRLDATVKRIPLTLRVLLQQRGAGRWDRNHIRLEIVWPVAVGRLPTLEIRRCSTLDTIARALGWLDRSVGDANFDRLFTVTSSASRDAVSRLVPIELRNVLFRFTSQGRRVSLSSNRSRWRLDLDAWPETSFEYLLLTDAAWASAEALLPDEPVAMLPPPPAGRAQAPMLRSLEGATLQLLPPDAGARARRELICQVCGQSLDGIVVACNSCDSLHHEDCWTYAGRCATFGCGSTASRPIHAHG